MIAGIVQDRDYFDSQVAPHVDGVTVSYVGPVGPAQRDQLLGGALALLHLISFDEPFGLSVVESLAAGTPVIACPRGSMGEIIRPDRTGFLVDGTDEAVDAVRMLGGIDRRDCRADARERFSAARMVADYERLFEAIAPPRESGYDAAAAVPSTVVIASFTRERIVRPWRANPRSSMTSSRIWLSVRVTPSDMIHATSETSSGCL